MWDSNKIKNEMLTFRRNKFKIINFQVVARAHE